MTTKIGITGVHGSGKSTLATKLERRSEQSGKIVYVVKEVARKCPYALGTICAQEYIWHNQIEKEKFAMRREVDMIICDRTVMDNLIYYYIVIENEVGNNKDDKLWERWNHLYEQACDWMSTYNIIIRLPLNLEYIKNDKKDTFRPKDEEYAIKIDRLFDIFADKWVSNHGWE